MFRDYIMDSDFYKRDQERRMMQQMRDEERQRQMDYANRGKAKPVHYPTLIDQYLERKKEESMKPREIAYGVNLRNGNIHF